MLEIILNNILAFPADICNDILSFFSSFYNPNNSILENIFYNEIIWVGFAVWFYIKNGGVGGLYLIVTLPLVWLLFHIIIKFLGIEIFFILLLIIIMCYYWRRGLNNILDVLFKSIKYVVLIVAGSYIILAVFGTLTFFIAIMIGIILIIISIIRKIFKKEK